MVIATKLMFWKPVPFEDTKLKLWVDPLPEDGVTETGAGLAFATVQVPIFCQPLVSPVLLAAYMKTFFGPAYAGGNVNAKLTVRLLPEPEDHEAPVSTLHWLFCSVPRVPNAFEPAHAGPASSIKYSELTGVGLEYTQPSP